MGMLQQVYYTSCATGLRGSPGFQVNAASAGLKRDSTTLALVERYSGYQPPLALAYTRGAALEDFPPSLTFYRLFDQVAVIARSVYLGSRGTDARGGNFFTHSLVSLEGAAAFGLHAPVQWWEADGWSDEASATPDLPELAPPPPNPSMQHGAVAAFLHAEPQRLAWLAPFIATAIACIVQQRRLLIAAPAAECAHWIAALTLALPRSLAFACTFTTYTRSPDLLPCTIVGVDPSGMRAWGGRSEMHPEWVVFHPPDTVPALPTPAPRFAAFAAAAYRERDAETLRAFAALGEQLRHAPTFEMLDHLVTLYQLEAGVTVEPSPVFHLAGFAPALFTEGPTVLSPLLHHLETLDVEDSQLQEAVGHLCASASGQAHPTCQEVLWWGARWMADYFVPVASPAALVHMGKQLDHLRPFPAQWLELVSAVRNRLHEAAPAMDLELLGSGAPAAGGLEYDHQKEWDEAATLVMALLRFIDHTGLVRPLEAEWRAALRSLMAHPAPPHPPNPTVARFLVELVQRQGSRVGNGVAEDEERAFATTLLVLETLPAGQGEMRRAVLAGVLAPMLHKLPSYDIVSKAFHTLHMEEATLWSVVESWLNDYRSAPRQEADSDWFVRLFRALTPLSRQTDQTPAVEVLSEALQGVWDSFGGKERSAIERTIRQRSSDAPLQTTWKQWRRSTTRPWFHFLRRR